MKAMIFAAGLGTRLKAETADKPKALVEVGGKTLLQRVIEKLKKEGIEEIVVNIHHFPEMMTNWIQCHEFGIPIHISDESGELLDTGGGLKKAASFFTGNDPVLVHNVDILGNTDLKHFISEHLNSGALATLAVRKRETQRYFMFDSEKQLTGWINKKTGEKKIARPETFEESTEMAFSGIHIVQPEIFRLMPAENRFSIIGIYLELAQTRAIKGYFDESDWWMDVGKPEELEAVRKLLG
jgi:NDP-sugar pyrophosphorylase family protein